MRLRPMRLHPILSLVVVGALCRPTVTAAQASDTLPGHGNMPMSGSAIVRGLLTSPLGSRGPSGTVTVAGTRLQVEWAGDKPGVSRAWSLRRGTCTRDEGIVATAASYTALAVDAAGTARSTVTLDAPLATGDALAVVVQSTPGEPTSLALACGPLVNGAPRAKAAPPNDHATMDHAGMNMSGATTSPVADTASAGLKAIHLRMMADPVIRERVRTDPVLQRMMADVPESGASALKPATKQTTKPATRPAAKPAVKPTPNTMPGMDHSKMPGMRKPPG